MIQMEDPVILSMILAHISEQRLRAKLSDKPFELGIVTDKQQSQILPLLSNKKNESALKEIGMTTYRWHDDALRSELNIAGEQLLFSICNSR